MKAARNAVRHATHFESIVVPDNKQKQDINYVGIRIIVLTKIFAGNTDKDMLRNVGCFCYPYHF
jgi:hypothetical protein